MPLKDDLNLLANFPGDPGLMGAEQGGFGVIERAAGLFGSGFNEGLANIVGLPVDAINAGLGAAGIPTSDFPIGGSRSIRAGIRAIGSGTAEDFPATGVGERFVQRMGEETGAAVLPLAGALRLARGAQGISRFSPRVTEILRPLAETPGRATSIELAQALSAGAGAQTAREISPESPGAEMLGQVAGGLTAGGIIGTGQRIVRGGKRLVEPFSPSGIQRRTARKLQESATRDPQRVVRDIEASQKIVGEAIGLQPTTAQAAGDPGLLAAERAVSRGTPEARGTLEDIVTQQRRGVRQTLEREAPIGRPEAVSEALEQQLADFRLTTERAIRQADERVQQAISSAGGDVSPQETNAIVRRELITAEKIAEDEAQDLFRRVDPSGSVQGNTSRLKNSAKSIKESVRKAERPENVPDVVDTIGRLEDVEPLEELMALRSRITDDIRQEVAQIAPNRRKIARLEKVKEVVDETILSDLIEPPGQDAAANFRAARQNFREFASRFRRGAPARVLRPGRLGEQSVVPESATVGQFFRPGKGASEAAQDFQRILGSNVAARQAVREAAVQDFANFAADSSGRLNVEKAKRWISRHREALNEFPDVKQQVDDIVGRGDAADLLREAGAKSIQRVERSAARFFLNTDPERAVRRILNSPDPAGGLKQLTVQLRGNKDALKGLKAAIFREGVGGAEIGIFDEEIAAPFLSPNRLRRFFSQNRRTLEQSGLYSKEELARIDKIIRAAEIVNRSVSLGVTGGSDTAQNIQGLKGLTGLTLPGLLSRFYSLARGVVSFRFVRAEIGSRVINNLVQRTTKAKVNSLMQQALVDPEVAKTLLTRITTQTEDAVIRRLRAHLANLGPVALGETEEGGTIPASEALEPTPRLIGP